MEFTDANFEEEVLKSDEPVFVDFWAPWCGPCQAMGPVVEQLAKEVPGAKVGKLNVDESLKTASAFGIMSIPTMKIFKGGKVVKEYIGVQPLGQLKSDLGSL